MQATGGTGCGAARLAAVLSLAASAAGRLRPWVASSRVAAAAARPSAERGQALLKASITIY